MADKTETPNVPTPTPALPPAAPTAKPPPKPQLDQPTQQPPVQAAPISVSPIQPAVPTIIQPTNPPVPNQPPRQHPPITAPLIAQTTVRPQVSTVPSPASNGPFRPHVQSAVPASVTGPLPSLQEGAQEFHYPTYQQAFAYPHYYQQQYDQYFPPTASATTTTTTTAPAKKRQASSGPNDPFGMGNPPPTAPTRKPQQVQHPPPQYAAFGPLYQNAYTTAQFPPGPDLPNSPFNPLATPYLAPHPGALPPTAAGLPLPYLPTGPIPEGTAPKRKRASQASALGLPPGTDGQPKRRRKSPEDLITDGDPFNFSKWTPPDDVLLKDCIQGAPSFEKIAKTVRFSAKFSAEQIKNRWNALLYDQKLAEEAAAAMAQLPSINRRVLWSEHEEDILRTEVHSTHFVSFQKVLERNRAIFHSSRTAKSLEAHYYRMKRHGTLQKMNFTNLTNSTFSQMEHSLYSSNDGAHFTDPDTLKDRQKQYRSQEKSTQRGTLRMEKELAREKDKRQKLLAIFRGRYLRYEMKSKEILLGRMSSDIVVDVDLSEEGNAAKVSRQQAVIKMKRDCDFYIKNIGRRLIFINGKPIEKGKRAHLADGSLIEIHNLQFIFEINKGLVSKLKKTMTS